MGEYQVRVATAFFLGSETWDNMSLSLVGPAGESQSLRLNIFGKNFRQERCGARVARPTRSRSSQCHPTSLLPLLPPQPQEEDFQVAAPQAVGPVLLLRVHEAPRAVLPAPAPGPGAGFCPGSSSRRRKATPSASPATIGWRGRGAWCCGGDRNVTLKLKGRLDSQRPWRSLDEIQSTFISFESPVSGVYYPDDPAVSRDSKLQAWVKEIFQEGFLSCLSSVLIQCLDAQYFHHHGVTPAHQANLVASFSEVNATCHTLVLFWGITDETKDTRHRYRGTYLDEHCMEEARQWSIAAYQSLLALISWDIREQSQGLVLPYAYLDPAVVEEHGTVRGTSPLPPPPPASKQMRCVH